MKLTSAILLTGVVRSAMGTGTPCEPKFVLYDASTSPATALTDIEDGDTINLDDYDVSPFEISIEYESCEDPDSVSFWVNHDPGEPKEWCENTAPFTIAGNDGGDYNPWDGNNYLGAIELKAVEHDAYGCKWNDRTEITKINFTLLNNPCPYGEAWLQVKMNCDYCDTDKTWLSILGGDVDYFNHDLPDFPAKPVNIGVCVPDDECMRVTIGEVIQIGGVHDIEWDYKIYYNGVRVISSGPVDFDQVTEFVCPGDAGY